MKKNILPPNLITLIILNIAAVTSSYGQGYAMHGHHADSQAKSEAFLTIMDTMMIKMDQVTRGRSADAIFLQQMIPHHEGAIAMAKYEIANGKNFEMVQLAKSILAEQQSEIIQMEIALKQLNPQPQANPGFLPAMNKTMDVMMKNLPAKESLGNIDQAFASVMLPHHQAAIDMARVILLYGKDLQTAAFAKALLSNEQIEAEQMTAYLAKL